MAEKSSELNSTDKLVSDENENLLEVPERNRSLSKTDDFDVDTTGSETDETDDAQQIRERIEETRSQMSETIDAIQEKLSIANITEQVKDQVTEQIGGAVESAKDAFYDKASMAAKSVGRSLGRVADSDLAKKARENPWILSVVGMGIGAILVGALSGGGRGRKKASAHRYKTPDGERGNRHIKQTRRKFDSDESINEKTDESVYQATRSKVGESANAVYESVSSAADSAYQSIGGAAGKTYESVGQASNFAYEKAGDLGEEMKKTYEQYIEENPLVVGAVAFAVGAAIGYAVPSTKVENQYLGEMRDNVFDKAQASAQNAIGTVKQVVGDAQQIIVDEVKSQVEEVKSQTAS